MKIFAIYLPQFHEIEENNNWWGKGFTEWTHVKAAKPLFDGHDQPRIPKNNYYYNLMDKETVLWQTELAKKYGIEGFAYYHYYFSGKLIMEKPAENFLKWKDIDHKFFFCWANHTWVQGKGANRKILIEQTYGDIEDWEKHYAYLLQFFKDERYEKIDNKPLLMIYVNQFDKKKEMLSYFEKRCIEEGFNGIYIIETYTGRTDKRSKKQFTETLTEQSEMVYYREPNVSIMTYYHRHPLTRLLHKMMREKNIPYLSNKVAVIEGSDLYKLMLKMEYPSIKSRKVAHGIFFEWDNTPRHKRRGYIVKPPERKLFNSYLERIQSDEYVFINAWNEWAEGMMLEPSESLGSKYLNWLEGR